MSGPTVAQLRTAVGTFSRYTAVEDSWALFLVATAPRVDLSVAEHRGALLRWLNAAGCRIRYPRVGEPDLFDTGIAEWWQRWGSSLPAPGVALTELTDEQVERAGACFEELSAT